MTDPVMEHVAGMYGDLQRRAEPYREAAELRAELGEYHHRVDSALGALEDEPCTCRMNGPLVVRECMKHLLTRLLEGDE